jgi:TRAP-type C4-dicarboxylate transport system permease small subunit
MRIAFFAAMTLFTAQMMGKLQGMQMSVVDLPMNLVYGVCLLGLACMTLRSIWVAKVHWQRGYSVLERPESTMQDR